MKQSLMMLFNGKAMNRPFYIVVEIVRGNLSPEESI